MLAVQGNGVNVHSSRSLLTLAEKLSGIPQWLLETTSACLPWIATAGMYVCVYVCMMAIDKVTSLLAQPHDLRGGV